MKKDRLQICKEILLKYPWILSVTVVLVIRILFYSTVTPYTLYPDSYDYMNFPFSEWIFLNFKHSGRTPIYPFVIFIGRLICGEQYALDFVIVLQIIVSFVSVIFFYKTCSTLIKNKKILFFSTILYGATPSIMGWDRVILTESLALSGTVFFLYFIVNFIVKPSFKYGFAVILLSFILTFERPSFLLFDCFLLGFWILRMFFYKTERKLLCKLLACSACVFVFIGLYSFIFYQAHGIFTISDPIPRQKVRICLDHGYYKSSSNQQFIDIIDQGISENPSNPVATVRMVLDHFGKGESLKLANESIIKNFKRYIADILEVAKTISGDRMLGYYTFETPSGRAGKILNDLAHIGTNVFAVFTVGHVYFFSLAEIIVFIGLTIKRKAPQWIHLGIGSFLCCIVITTLVATYAEFPRTMVHVLPFVYLSFTMFINWLTEVSGINTKSGMESL